MLCVGSGPCLSTCYQPVATSKNLTRSYATDSNQNVIKPDVFGLSKRGSFFQPMPELLNPFADDGFLRRCLKRLMPTEVLLRVYKLRYVLLYNYYA